MNRAEWEFNQSIRYQDLILFMKKIGFEKDNSPQPTTQFDLGDGYYE
ncbi:MAG: hypothetical protein ACE5DL_06060 [Nitrosopumilaceae archaeon]